MRRKWFIRRVLHRRHLTLFSNHIENQRRELRTAERKYEKSWVYGKVEQQGKGGRGTNVVVSLRDVNEPVNTLTTTSERFEAGWHMRPCIRPDCLLHLLRRAFPPPYSPFILLPNPSDEMIIIVRNRRAAHFRACRSRRIIFHPLK